MSKPSLVVVGGGWAGLAAAVAGVRAGWRVTLLEASRHWGGRARSLTVPDGHGGRLTLDNGQHILIGAYTATLGLLTSLGVAWPFCLQRLPLALRHADGTGVAVPGWASALPAAMRPLGLAAGLLGARGWRWRERVAALAWAARWQRRGWTCAPQATVADLCLDLPPRVVEELIEPLVVAALNTPMQEASATVFLRVLRDALQGAAPAPLAASDLLVPRTDLGALLPQAATAWLAAHGAALHRGQRVQRLIRDGQRWHLQTATGLAQEADAVVLATPAWDAARLAASWAGDAHCPAGEAQRLHAWAARAQSLRHAPIATVYLRPPRPWRWRWPTPMLALRCVPQQAPAQFVFARTLGGTAAEPQDAPVLAAVVSIPHPAWWSDRVGLEQAVRRQVAQALGCPDVQALATVMERRATFACTPQLQRPAPWIGAGLVAAGDYVEGPYPATLEGAVRSGLAAVAVLEREGRGAPGA